MREGEDLSGDAVGLLLHQLFLLLVLLLQGGQSRRLLPPQKLSELFELLSDLLLGGLSLVLAHVEIKSQTGKYTLPTRTLQSALSHVNFPVLKKMSYLFLPVYLHLVLWTVTIRAIITYTIFSITS